MRFGISEKPTRDSVSPYNNAGLISEVSEGIASESCENCCCRQQHCCLTPPPQGIPANIRINIDQLFIAKTRILGISVGEDFVVLACVVLTQCQRVTDRRTDGQLCDAEPRISYSLRSKLC